LGGQGWCKITEEKKYFGAKSLDTLLENGKNMKKSIFGLLVTQFVHFVTFFMF